MFKFVGGDMTPKEKLECLSMLVEPRLYTLGEVIDEIEIGQLALSLEGTDIGMALSVAVDGRIFMFDGESTEEDIEITYNLNFIKSVEKPSPPKRFIILKEAQNYIGLKPYTKEQDNPNVGHFETCWDDDQIEISEWISDKLHKNPSGWFKVTVMIEEDFSKDEGENE